MTTPTSGGTRGSIPPWERSRYAPPTRNSICGAWAPSLLSFTVWLGSRQSATRAIFRPGRRSRSRAFRRPATRLEAKLLDRSGEPVPARDLGRKCLETVTSAAQELGCERELEYITVILEEGSGADLQRQVHAVAGMEGLLDFLVDETARLDRAA